MKTNKQTNKQKPLTTNVKRENNRIKVKYICELQVIKYTINFKQETLNVSTNVFK